MTQSRHPKALHAHPQESSVGNWLQVSQPRLGTVGLVLLLAVANIICPLSLDMYTPAVPELPAQFNTTASVVNLTISGFYLFFAIGMLLFGPVCDRAGRKPVLVGGLVAFSAGSVACAAAWSIEALILFRLIEATGAGAVCAVSTAIIKDCFKPERRTALLSVLQVIMVIGPVVAPCGPTCPLRAKRISRSWRSKAAGFFDRVWISAILLDEVRGFADGHYRERNENELVLAL